MSNLIDSTLALLNSWNPLHRAPSSDTSTSTSSDKAHTQNPDTPTHTIWLLDATASQSAPSSSSAPTTTTTPTLSSSDETHKWHLQLMAAYFASNTSPKLADVLEEVRNLLGFDTEKDGKELRTVEERLRPFFIEVLEGRGCRVDFREVEGNRGSAVTHDDGGDGKVVVRLGRQGGVDGNEGEGKGSDANGISRDDAELVGTWKDGDVVLGRLAGRDAKRVEKEVDNGLGVDETVCVEASVTLAGPTGWAVISDIDDTIKTTLTNSATGILRTTFVDTPQPIRGMPELYHSMLKTLDDPPFWYLSASPYNLYPFLHAFRVAHYPHGTMLLKNASWQNIAGFLGSLSKDVQEYKVEKLKGIQARWPKRRVVLIGDSTQKDPESYAQVAKEFPEWVGRVFIRRVGDVKEFTDILPGQGNEERNAPERFEKAFEGLDKKLWHVFDEPDELYAKLDEAVKEFA